MRCGDTANDYLAANDLLPRFQSVYRKRHSTETAMLRLLQRLQLGFGFAGAVLEWICSFLQGRTQQVLYSGQASIVQQLLFGVPQGSVLGPLLFVRLVHSRTKSRSVFPAVRRRQPDIH